MGRGINTTFTEEDVARFRREGGTDWYDLAMKNLVPQTHHNVTASGSGKRTQYFLSIGYYGEDGIWKTGDLNYHRYNIRSNLSFDVTKDLKAELLIGAMSDEKNQPYKDTWEQFKAIWMLKPTETPYANNNESFPNDVMYGLNPLMITDADQSGYKRRINRTLNTTFTLTYKAPFLKGLSAKFLYAYDYKNYQQKEFQKQYTLYKYDREKDVYNSQIYSSPSSIYRKSWEGAQNQLQASLNYERLFAEKHNLKVLFLYEQSAKEEDNLWAKRNFEMDAVDEIFAGSEEEQIGNADAGQIYRVTNMGLVGRVNYDYQSKYLAEVSFRYDGSSKFAKGHRWGFFPSASVGYRISEESFIKEFAPLSFITNWKFRASYGAMGDDGSSSYQYLSGYDYPGASYVFGDVVYKGLGFRGLPNELITWYKSKTLNVGTDLDLWNGMLSAQVDNGGGLPLVKFNHNAGHENTPDDPEYVKETGHPSYRADDALWLFPPIAKYVGESGNAAFYDEVIVYANGGEDTVYDHLKRAIQFSMERLGDHNMPAGLHADWNDCLRLGKKGESTFVAFQLYYAMTMMKKLAAERNDAVYVDLFGGSGLLAHITKQEKSEARVVYNDFDNYRQRLENVGRTNALLAELREMVKDYPRGKLLPKELHERIIQRLEAEEATGFVDYITLSSSLLFSMKYAVSLDALRKERLYNNEKMTDYDCEDNLDEQEVVSMDYKA